MELMIAMQPDGHLPRAQGRKADGALVRLLGVTIGTRRHRP